MYSLFHPDDVSDHHSQLLSRKQVKKMRLSGSPFLSEETSSPLQGLIDKDWFSKHKHGLLLVRPVRLKVKVQSSCGFSLLVTVSRLDQKGTSMQTLKGRQVTEQKARFNAKKAAVRGEKNKGQYVNTKIQSKRQAAKHKPQIKQKKEQISTSWGLREQSTKTHDGKMWLGDAGPPEQNRWAINPSYNQPVHSATVA